MKLPQGGESESGSHSCPCCGRDQALPQMASKGNGAGGENEPGPVRMRQSGTAGILKVKPAESASAAAVIGVPEGMTLIPAGSFLSGDRKVPRTLRAFSIDTTPVTEGEYKKFLAAAGKQPKAGAAGSRPSRFDRHPVTQITWYEANEFAEHYGKRLPTVYEWEKAARGVDGRHFPFGNTFKPGCGQLRASAQDGARRPAQERATAQVGTHPAGASPYGVQDMAGNVLEWTSSARRSGERLFRAVKGASFQDGSPELARCTGVQYIPPEFSEPHVGFRCVSDVE